MPADAYEDRALVSYLPDEVSASNPWMQIVRDCVAPAPVCDYASSVTARRIGGYDEIRSFVMRGALLVGIGACFVLVGVSAWWAYVLLIPGVVQTASEIYSDFWRKGRTHDLDRSSFFYVKSQFERTISNYTGWLGFVAVLCNLCAVLFTPPGEPVWVKLMAFLLAGGYAASGVSAVLLDATHYSRHQVRFLRVWFRPLRGQVWILVALVAVGMVAWSALLGRWDSAMVAPAYMTAIAVPAVMGMRVRDYDRLLRAGAEETAAAMTAARHRYYQAVHDIALSSIKALLHVIQDQQVPEWIRSAARQSTAELSGLQDIVDEASWIRARPHRAGTVAATIAGGLGLRADVVYEMPVMNPDNARLVQDFMTTALLNVSQAYARAEPPSSDRMVRVLAYAEEGILKVEIVDDLDLVPDDDFCAPGTTLGGLQSRIKEAGGMITQEMRGGGKAVIAQWPTVRPRYVLQRRVRRSMP
jgi:hypothetical protein